MNLGPRPIWEPWKIPREDGGWCCRECGEILLQEDFLGTYQGILFQVRGYKCHKCGHHHGAGREYNWRILPIPTIHSTHAGAT